jgi:chromosome segregation and condensation protein ScpB
MKHEQFGSENEELGENSPLTTEELREIVRQGRAQQIIDRLTELEKEEEEKRKEK